MRKLAMIFGCALLAACSGNPTADDPGLDGVHPSLGGFTMGSGNRDGGSVTDMTTSYVAGGIGLGSGGRESGTTATDSADALAGGTLGSGF